jgi:hypothetical protein
VLVLLISCTAAGNRSCSAQGWTASSLAAESVLRPWDITMSTSSSRRRCSVSGSRAAALGSSIAAVYRNGDADRG